MASFPTAVVLSRVVYGTDIRAQGSGNAGAANMLRSFGWKPAALVLVVDVAKGFLPTLFVTRLPFLAMPRSEEILPLIAGTAAVVGHCYPLFAGLRGGKGVATAAGMFLALFPLALVVCVAVFTTIAASTRRVALASVVASVAMPISLLVSRAGLGHPTSRASLLATTLIAGFIVFTHRANLSRIWHGTEPRVGR